MEELLNAYYADNAKKLHQLADKILCRFGGLYDKDCHDFYSIANEVFVDVMKRYDGKQAFDVFLYSCLLNKFKTEMTSRNTIKRMADRNVISIDMPVDDCEDLTVGDMIPSGFDVETAVLEEMSRNYDERVVQYLSSLNKIQRQILEMKMADMPVCRIKAKLKLSGKQYNQQWEDLKSFRKVYILYGNDNRGGFKKEMLNMGNSVTMEKSKEYNLSVVSIAKKMDKHILRFDHPLQREADQWSPAMRGNLISDILQGNPIPALIFAEQVVNDVAIVWNLDGKQKCTNMYMYMKDGYKVSKNIRRWKIAYQTPVVDESGNMVLDGNGFPVYERKEFDIRGEKVFRAAGRTSGEIYGLQL